MKGALLALVVPILAGCHDAARITVAAAASLRELCERTGPAFTAAHPGVTLAFSFDASSTLARQIAAGSGFDVFLSADAETVERVRGQLAEATVTRFLGNRLVLVARDGLLPVPATPEALTTLAGRLALAGAAVPAGRYARTWLGRRGLLTALEPRIVNGESVRAALALVESGAADAGLVYHTDAQFAPHVKLAFVVPPAEDPGIAYVAAALRAAPSAATDYVRWLRSDRFQSEAKALGFLPPP